VDIWEWPAERIRAIRQRTGLSYARIGRLVGVSTNTVTMWAQTGVRRVEPTVLGRLFALEAAAGSTPIQRKANELRCVKCAWRWPPKTAALPKACPRCGHKGYEIVA